MHIKAKCVPQQNSPSTPAFRGQYQNINKNSAAACLKLIGHFGDGLFRGVVTAGIKKNANHLKYPLRDIVEVAKSQVSLAIIDYFFCGRKNAGNCSTLQHGHATKIKEKIPATLHQSRLDLWNQRFGNASREIAAELNYRNFARQLKVEGKILVIQAAS